MLKNALWMCVAWVLLSACALIANAVHDYSQAIQNRRAALRQEVGITQANVEMTDALAVRMRQYCGANKQHFHDWADCNQVSEEIEKLADSERSLAEEVKQREGGVR